VNLELCSLLTVKNVACFTITEFKGFILLPPHFAFFTPLKTLVVIFSITSSAAQEKLS